MGNQGTPRDSKRPNPGVPDLAQAACRDVDADLFFPGNDWEIPDLAAAVCARCPVRKPCLAYATADRSIIGVWAGTNYSQRHGLARTRLHHDEPTNPEAACQQCGIPFTVTQASQAYCSVPCRVRAEKLRKYPEGGQLTCAAPDCEATFPPIQGGKRYCSRSCKYRTNNAACRRERTLA